MYICNLDWCKNELKNFDDQMKKRNLKYNKFKAISKYDIGDNFIKNTDRLTENFKNSIISKELSVGHLCSTLSHYEIYIFILFQL